MPEESLKAKQTRAKNIVSKLSKVYPHAECALTFSNPWELFVATVLSAQCTDKRVNMVTPAVFKRYRTLEDYAEADPQEFEGLIRSTGFYKNKAKNILAAAKKVRKDFKGRLPDRLEDLVTLPGAGRKTANVILGNAFGVPGLTVDTHMIRLNNRLGLTAQSDPVKIEFELMKLIPQKEWTNYSHRVIHHGRSRCPARKPDCVHCELAKLCPSYSLKI